MKYNIHRVQGNSDLLTEITRKYIYTSSMINMCALFTYNIEYYDGSKEDIQKTMD